jgi:hypothetical protein
VSSPAAHSLGPIGDAAPTLLDAGKVDGTIRPDVDARDVILLIGSIVHALYPVNGMVGEGAAFAAGSRDQCGKSGG